MESEVAADIISPGYPTWGQRKKVASGLTEARHTTASAHSPDVVVDSFRRAFGGSSSSFELAEKSDGPTIIERADPRELLQAFSRDIRASLDDDRSRGSSPLASPTSPLRLGRRGLNDDDDSDERYNEIRAHNHSSYEDNDDSVDEDDIEAAIKRAFDTYDLNGDGLISFLELKTAFAQRSRHVPSSEIRRWLAERDSSGTGTVNFEDFRRSYLKKMA